MNLMKKLTALMMVVLLLAGTPVIAEDMLPDSVDMGEVVVVDGVAINEQGEEIEGFEIREDLQEIVDDGEDIHIECQFCDTIYTFTPDEVRGILAEI